MNLVPSEVNGNRRTIARIAVAIVVLLGGSAPAALAASPHDGDAGQYSIARPK